MNQPLNVGIDVGSTTVKISIFENGKPIFEKYERHKFDVEKTIRTFFDEAMPILKDRFITICLTGSAGMQVSEALSIPFVQEVVSCTLAVRKLLPPVDVILELGGEDAKIVYFTEIDGQKTVTSKSLSSETASSSSSTKEETKPCSSACSSSSNESSSCSCSDCSSPKDRNVAIDSRMNTMCAAGTGAFIDQMAALLETDAEGLNNLAKTYTHLYTIASRCGVFAKSDVQPLLNEGVPKSDVAASVLQSVVNQTISGLASGKPIKGRVAFLGGPLHFLSELRNMFIKTLALVDESEINTILSEKREPEGEEGKKFIRYGTGLLPENAQFYVARGAALYSASQTPFPTAFLQGRIEKMSDKLRAASYKQLLPPLFESAEALNAFRERHSHSVVPRFSMENARGPLFLGIDCGSTTIKGCLTNLKGEVGWMYYTTHQGNPLKAAIDMFTSMWTSILEEPKPTEEEKAAGKGENGFEKPFIARAVATGYGENLIKAAFLVDDGMVETMCHLKAAQFFQPDVDFVLDIGGQDMKSMTIDVDVSEKSPSPSPSPSASASASASSQSSSSSSSSSNDSVEKRRRSGGVISTICLNEACSSGCGSFIQTLSATLEMPITEFSAAGLRSKQPVDLGSRCTVFMNSRIKQAQKDCATVEDISAGLALSIIKNALFKVIRIHDPKELGTKVVVQGGTFLNDSVLRAAEIVFDTTVVRPDIAGHMGAFGAALVAQEQWEKLNAEVASAVADTTTKQDEGEVDRDETPMDDEDTAEMTKELKKGLSQTSFLSLQDIKELKWESTSRRCGQCVNNCQLTVHRFSHHDGAEHISGNKCERGLPPDQRRIDQTLPDLVAWHRQRVFSPKLYTPLLPKDAPRGTLGIPRALFMWEDYPMWFTVFTKLGFRVIISRESNEKMHLKAMETIPSEAACYPAKLMHGHVADLIERKVDAIFFPMHLYGRKEVKDAPEHFYCALLSTYAAMINNSFDFKKLGIKYFMPPVLIYEEDKGAKRFGEEVHKMWPEIKKSEGRDAFAAGCKAFKEWREEYRRKGEEAIQLSRSKGKPLAVLAAYPYQLDGIHCGAITPMLLQEGYTVLTADAIAHLGADAKMPYEILNMYSMDGRILEAAKYVCKDGNEDFIFIYLSSFGCGVTPSCHEQCCSWLKFKGRMYANIKIDQALNMGAVRVRIRSLVAAHRMQRYRHTLPLVAPSSSPAASSPPAADTPSSSSTPSSSPSPSQSAGATPVSFKKELVEVVVKQGLKSIPKKPYTVLVSNFSEEHTDGYCAGLNSEGWNFVVCPDFKQQETVDMGLRYVNNDCCYGAILIVGGIILALKKGLYDPDKTHVAWIHMGGSCSSRSLAFTIRRGLIQAGYPQVGVSEFNYNFLCNPELSISQTLRVNYAFVMNDLLTRLYHRCHPYEKEKGSSMKLWKEWKEKTLKHVEKGSILKTKSFMKKMVKAFEKLPLVTEERTKPRVGIIGTMCKVEPEFYYWLLDYLVDEEGCEVSVLDFYGYAIAPSYNAMNAYNTYSFPFMMKVGGFFANKMIATFIDWGSAALKGSKRFDPMMPMSTVLERTWSIVPKYHISGEGWFYTSQFVFLLDQGVDNFICTTPFDCMPVHLGCRGAMKQLKEMFPKLNACILDFDAGTSRMNLTNRIRLMLNSMPERQLSGPKKTLCSLVDLEDLVARDASQTSVDSSSESASASSSSSSSQDEFAGKMPMAMECKPSACRSCASSATCSILSSALLQSSTSSTPSSIPSAAPQDQPVAQATTPS